MEIESTIEQQEQLINKVKELRAKYKNTNDKKDLDDAYCACQRAYERGVDVSWYYPWIMNDYLKRMLDEENIRGYFHTLDTIAKKGLLTNGKVPLEVQKKFILVIQK